MILVIDNYDSFTYNLVQYFGMLGQDVVVKRNDEVTLAEIHALNPDKIVLSPGPGRPEHAGVTVSTIQEFYHTTPILGVCLGHQAIAQAFGGNVVPAVRLMHGKSDRVHHDNQGILHGIAQDFDAGRYHSLAVDVANASELTTQAMASDGTIMAIAHREFPVFGIQFHPESILTPVGMDILKNFIAVSPPVSVKSASVKGGVS